MSARRWLPPASWAAVILVLTSIPASFDGPGGIPHLDKLAHFLVYAAQGWLVARALRSRRPLALAAALLGVAAFAAFDEWHQRFFLRDASVLDWLADVIGASVGIAAASRVRELEAAR